MQSLCMHAELRNSMQHRTGSFRGSEHVALAHAVCEKAGGRGRAPRQPLHRRHCGGHSGAAAGAARRGRACHCHVSRAPDQTAIHCQGLLPLKPLCCAVRKQVFTSDTHLLHNHTNPCKVYRRGLLQAGHRLGLLQVFLKKLLRQEGARPEFTFKEGQSPEQARDSVSPHHPCPWV